MKRIYIVTGAYGAIGKAIAAGLAADKQHRVVLVGRNEDRLKAACADIIGLSGNASVKHEVVDLSRKSEIVSFAERWRGPLHVLVNNHATAPGKRTETPEGIEMQWAANVLGYFWMIRYFYPFIAGQVDARIVNVASYWAGGLDLRDPEFRRRPYDNDTAYRQAKQADRMLAAAFAEQLRNEGITVNAAHPGDVNSKLSNSLGFGGSESPEQGAATPLFLALSPEAAIWSGKYLENSRITTCRFMQDKLSVNELYHLCETW